MSGIGIGFAVEALVTILLAITVGYCFMLDKRLRRFRADEHGMRQTVVDLAIVSERAENAIAGLKITLAEADGSLSQRLRAAEAFSVELDAKIKSGDQVLNRISKIVASSRQASNHEVEVVENQEQASPEQASPEQMRMGKLAEMLSAARAMANRGRGGSALNHALNVNSHLEQTAA